MITILFSSYKEDYCTALATLRYVYFEESTNFSFIAFQIIPFNHSLHYITRILSLATLSSLCSSRGLHCAALRTKRHYVQLRFTSLQERLLLPFSFSFSPFKKTFTDYLLSFLCVQRILLSY